MLLQFRIDLARDAHRSAHLQLVHLAHVQQHQ